METPARGGIKSPKDYRDALASASITLPSGITLPTTFQSNVGPVLMQAQEPACVSFSVAENLKLYWFKKTGEWIDFSPRFLDTLVKRFDGQDRATAGTFPRMVFKLAVQYGCATTATLPNDTTLPVLEYRNDSLLTAEVFAEAAKYKVPGYIAVPIDFQNTRNAIFLYGAISTLFHIGDELWTPSWNDADIDPLRTPAVVDSGHQMTPKGWATMTLNTLRNHWSIAWANQGEANYDPVAWAPFIMEQWAIAEIPSDVSDFLKALPAPANFHYEWNTNLLYGDHNQDVQFLQIALMILGYLAPIPQSGFGYYGPMTATAVGAYQKANGISAVPNSCGPQTRGKLNAQFAI